jgi:hypothetical protein
LENWSSCSRNIANNDYIFGIIQKVYHFFSSSVLRWEKLLSIIKVTLKAHSDTRWSSKKRAVSAINEHITHIYEILQCILNDETLSVDTVEKAKCLLRLFKFKIFILLDIWDLILIQIDLVNCFLQSKKSNNRYGFTYVKRVSIVYNEYQKQWS